MASKLEAVAAVVKNVVSVLRDSVIFLLFLLLLFAPSTIKNRLIASGFTKASIAGFQWEAQLKSAAEETKAVGQTVGQAAEDYNTLIERLGDLEKRITDPSVKAEVNTLSQVAEASRVELTTADRAIKRSLAKQQQVVSEIGPSPVADSGWLFLGRVTEDKSAWSGSPHATGPTSTPPSPGTKLTMRDAGYLRADGPSNVRSSAAILGVAKAGDTFDVVELDYSHARGGGWFVWAKVGRD